jgi:hypothetical protein
VEVGRLTEIHTTDKGLNYLLIEEEKVFLPKSTDLGQYRIVEVLKRNELDAERSSKSAFLVGEPTMKRTDFEDLKTAVAEAADGLQGLWESIFRPNFPCRYTKDEKFLGLPHLYVDADRHFQSLVNHQQELYLPANIELATNILEAISLCESNLDLVGRKGFYLPSEWESNLRQPGWQIFIETLKAFGNPKAILGSFEYRANIGTREGAAWLASGIPAKGVATSITYKINKEEKIINLLDRGKFIVDGFVGEIIPLLTEAEIADLCAANGMSVINQSLTHGKGFDSDTVKFCLKKLSV